jgi:hypothetical protein
VFLTGKGIKRTVRVHPGQRIPLSFNVPSGGEWTLSFHVERPGFLGDRAISVHAPRALFTSR